MSYLGKFSIEEIEQIKRSLCDPKINDIFKIKPTYISPLKSLGKEDNLVQKIIFSYPNNSDEKENGRGRSR